MTTITARIDLACPADPTHQVRHGDTLTFVPGVGFTCAECAAARALLLPTAVESSGATHSNPGGAQ